MSVATTYAEALYEAGAQEGALARVSAELAEFHGALSESPELAAAFENPEVAAGAKKGVVDELAAGAHALVTNLLQVLLDRGRFDELGAIVDAFGARVADAEGRIEVHALTAVPLPDDLRDRIVERVGAHTGREVSLTQGVEPDIIGGLVLQVGSTVVDGSVRHGFRDLRSTLVGAPVEAAISPD